MSAPSPYQIIQCAKELHDSYRAADKAFSGAQKHDHSFRTCHRKVYWLRRAVRVLRQRAAKVPF